MANQKVVVEMSAEDAAMVAAWQRGRVSVEEFISTMGAIGPTSTKADRAAEELQKTLRELAADGAKLRASLVTPQEEYAKAIARANQLLNAGEIAEAEYAMAVDKAKQALDLKDVSLQKLLRDADGMRQRAITPEQDYTKAVTAAKAALDKKMISQEVYDKELKIQNDLLQKAQEGHAGVGSAASSSVAEMTQALTGMGIGIGVITSAAQALKAEYQSLLESQKNAADKQLDTAAAQRSAIFALGDDEDMSPEEMTSRAEEIALKNGVSTKAILETFANSLSSKSALTAEDALSAADIATEALPFSGAVETAGSLLDMKNIFGGTHRQMMGLSFGTQQASRVKDAESFMKNAIPSIVNVGRYGDSAEQSSALVAAMSTAMTDLEGRRSGTASEQLANQLELALPEATTGLKNTTERREFLRSPQGEKKRIELFGDGAGNKGSAHFESGAQKAMFEFMQPGDNATNRAYDAAVQAIPSVKDSDEYYTKAMARVNRQSLQIVSAMDRQQKAAAEASALNNVQGSTTSIAREGLDKALQNSGEGWMSRAMTAREFNYQVDVTGMESPQEFASRKLNEKADKLSETKRVESGTGFVDIKPTAEALATAEDLRKVADSLEKLNANLEKNAVILNENNKVTAQNNVVQKTPAPVPTRKTNGLPPKKVASVGVDASRTRK